MLALADTYERFPVPAGRRSGADRRRAHGRHRRELRALRRPLALLPPRRRRIGRVCLPIFGARDEVSTAGPEAETLADDLGVAMQLTNILRDVREDAENGRVYLPAEDLRRFGVLGEQDAGDAPAMLASLLRGVPGSDGHAADGGELESAVCARALPGRSRASVVPSRDGARAAARQAQRRVPAGHGRHLPQAAQSHPGAPRAGAGRPHLVAGSGEGLGGDPQHAEAGALEAP